MAKNHTIGLEIKMQGAGQVQGAVRSVSQELDKIGPAAQAAVAIAALACMAVGFTRRSRRPVSRGGSTRMSRSRSMSCASTRIMPGR